MSRRTVPLVFLLAIALSGCFKINLDIEVNDDGSGTIGGLIALDTEAAAQLASIFEEEGAEAPSRDELCEEFLTDTDVPEGATTEPFDDGKFCGVRFSQDFTAAELDSVVSESLAGDGTGDFDIRRDGDGWRFDATFSEEATGDADFFPSELFSDAEFVIRVKLPGRQVEYNADRIEGDGTMVWDVNLFEPGPALMARTEPGSPITGSGGDDGSNTALIIVAVLAVLALAIGYLWWRKRSGTAAVTDPGQSASTGPTDAPPTTPPATPAARPHRPPLRRHRPPHRPPRHPPRRRRRADRRRPRRSATSIRSSLIP